MPIIHVENLEQAFKHLREGDENTIIISRPDDWYGHVAFVSDFNDGRIYVTLESPGNQTFHYDIFFKGVFHPKTCKIAIRWDRMQYSFADFRKFVTWKQFVDHCNEHLIEDSETVSARYDC
jgi:hypothetical protein